MTLRKEFNWAEKELCEVQGDETYYPCWTDYDKWPYNRICILGAYTGFIKCVSADQNRLCKCLLIMSRRKRVGCFR